MIAMLRFIAWALALALVALPVVAVVNGWVGAERFPLRKLRVTSQFERVDPQLLRQTVLPYAKQGFFAVQLEDAQDAVSKLPWVDRAEVRKHWPDVLEIRLVEHAPFARWGKDRLLSQQGRLLPVKGIDVPKGLPQLDGPDTRTADVVALYNESRAMFTGSGTDVRGIALDPRGSWSLTLGNAAQVVVGRGDEDARLRLARFARLLPRLLAQQQRPLRRADLRYTNGFALSWGEEPGTGNRTASAGGRREQRSWPGGRATRVASQSGTGEGQQQAVAWRFRFHIPRSRVPAFSIPHSPFPIPGPTT